MAPCVNLVSIIRKISITSCSVRRTFASFRFPCNSTSMCRNWAGGPNLQCLVAPSGSIQQCLCTPTQYFDYCADYCFSAKAWQQPCNSSTCYATSYGMCDQTRALTCQGNLCNCSNTQWWNSTICLPKGNRPKDAFSLVSLLFRYKSCIVCNGPELSMPTVQWSFVHWFSMSMWINGVLEFHRISMFTGGKQRSGLHFHFSVSHSSRRWFELHQQYLQLLLWLRMEFNDSTMSSHGLRQRTILFLFLFLIHSRLS